MIENTEYAIELPGRGLYDPWAGIVSGEVRHPYDRLDDAMEGLALMQQKYADMGCAEIGLTAQVVSRTTTLTYSDWEPEKLFV